MPRSMSGQAPTRACGGPRGGADVGGTAGTGRGNARGRSDAWARAWIQAAVSVVAGWWSRMCRWTLQALRALPACLASCLHRQMEHSLDDIRHAVFWRGVAAEFTGAIFLVLVTCGGWVFTDGEDTSLFTLRVAICYGLSYGAIMYCLRQVSGGHVNPAVSIAMLVARKVSVARAIFYLLVQIVGGVTGAGLLYALTAKEHRGNLGVTMLTDKLTPEQGFGIEFFGTFLLVFVFFASTDKKPAEGAASGPFAVALILVAAVLFAVSLLS